MAEVQHLIESALHDLEDAIEITTDGTVQLHRPDDPMSWIVSHVERNVLKAENASVSVSPISSSVSAQIKREIDELRRQQMIATADDTGTSDRN